MKLAAENEEGLSIDDELGGRAAGFKVGRGGLLCAEGGGLNARNEQKHWQRGKRDLHDVVESTTGDAHDWKAGASSDLALWFICGLRQPGLFQSSVAFESDRNLASLDGRSFSRSCVSPVG